jgi:hypothetical protein
MLSQPNGEKYDHSLVGPGTKRDCAGKKQQQFVINRNRNVFPIFFSYSLHVPFEIVFSA